MERLNDENKKPIIAVTCDSECACVMCLHECFQIATSLLDEMYGLSHYPTSLDDASHSRSLMAFIVSLKLLHSR